MPALKHDQAGNPIDDAGKAGKRKEVMNAKGAATLAKWGFARSNFGDTQHFDHVEGYRDAVEDGRSYANMNKKYSPASKWILEEDAVPTTTPVAPTTPKPP